MTPEEAPAIDRVPPTSDTNSILIIEPTAARWLSLASIQNGLPILREVKLQWKSNSGLRDVEVSIKTEPEFIFPYTLRIDRLDPTGIRCFDSLPIQPRPQFVAELTEPMQAVMQFEASSNGRVLASHSVPIRLLPPEQWEGIQDIPELLAAHVQPNHPFVGRILARSAQLLKRAGLDGFTGYQRQSREVVGKQIAAIYASLRDERLAYANPPAHFESRGQRIRLPDQIEAERLATCLDLAVLFSACLEQAGLHPIILFKKGHAWVGCWLDEGPSLSGPFDDDGHTLRKRHSIGELSSIELTQLVQEKVLIGVAAKVGAENLADEEHFEGALDVRLSREAGIRPLPARVAGMFTLPADAEVKKSSGSLDESLDVAAAAAPVERDAEEELPNQRLERWKRKLLDLSLRNRLLNFKPTSKTFRLIGTHLSPLEDALADGKSFGFEVNPRFDQQRDATTKQLLPAELVRDRLDSHVVAAAKRGKLVILEDDKEKIETRLVELFRAARTAEEEGGASPLYLALGVLEWKETDTSESVNRAPILLVPVMLDRSSVRAGLSGLKLASRDEDTRVNPTLLEKLRRDFGLAFDVPDIAPADEKGVDVNRILALFKHIVVTRKGWDVKEEIWLGEFSFRKFLMWRDLQERESELKENFIVKQMLEKPHTPIPSQGSFPNARELDSKLLPEFVYTPLIADSSQLAAIQAASDGKSFVLEGPPGTGKSQTITNLIAHCLAHGKTVLFVSEKRAALEVVRSRLVRIGLGAYCLEVHSDKARKAEIIEQLKAPLAVEVPAVRTKWSRLTSELSSSRQALNEYVSALHDLYPCGLSIFQSTSWLSNHAGVSHVRLGWGNPAEWNRPSLEKMRSVVNQIPPLLKELGNLESHALNGSAIDEWSVSIERDIRISLQALKADCAELSAACSTFGARFDLFASDLSLAETMQLVAVAKEVLEYSELPRLIYSALGNIDAQENLRSVAELIQQRRQPAEALFRSYRQSFLSCDVTKLENLRQESSVAWWPKSWFVARKLRKSLQPHIREELSFESVLPDITNNLEKLRTVQELDHSIGVLSEKITLILGSAWRQEKTDPVLLSNCSSWLSRLEVELQGLSRLDAVRAERLMEAVKRLLSVAHADLQNGGMLKKEAEQLLKASNEMEKSAAIFKSCLKLIEPSVLEGVSPGHLKNVEKWLGRISQSIDWDNLRYWAAWRRVREDAGSMGLVALVDYLEADAGVKGSIAETFEASVRNWLLEEGLSRSKPLRDFIGQSQDQLIERFRKLDAQYLALASKAAAAQIDERIPRGANEEVGSAEFGLLNREINKKMRHRPLRQLFAGMPKLMTRLKPCLLMSPLSVAQHLDPDFPPFDLVVFDEASQIPVWDAIGAIARARQAVIVGDPKQMPPTAFFSRVEEDEEVDDSNEDLESILDETMTTLPVLRLQWHYRSQYESLITFSNRRYYDGKLVTFPSPVTADRAVSLHRINGKYGRGTTRTNMEEALAVVAFVLDHVANGRSAKSSLGVVTFNVQQQQLIEDLLDKARRENPALEQHFSKELESEEIFVKNLENVQGDERDIIVFSTTFGPDDLGKMSLNFGPINGANGPRRLNVAVTRARLAMHVFSSIQPEMFDTSRTSSIGVRHFKEFLEYAEKGVTAMKSFLESVGEESESPFEEAVASALRQRGWEVHHQIGCGGYRVDLGVVHPNAPGTYLMGVECDGASYHSGATARDRDRLRHFKLEELGWKLHRIWSTDWWRRQHDVIATLDSKLRAAVDAKT